MVPPTLMNVFGYSKANLLYLLKLHRKDYEKTMYAKEIDRAIRLVKNCNMKPHSKYLKLKKYKK